jgi:cytochrome c oxidase subunit 1/cytochrome c oxidase subunit I+III
MLGMRRRVYTFLAGDGITTLNLLTSLGSFLLALGVCISLVNFARSWRAGRAAGHDPWRADTLEWSVASPPAAYGFLRIPVVRTLHPLWDDHDEYDDPRDERVLDRGRQTLSTSAIDARPVAITQGEPETIVPLLLALAITATFAALLSRSLVSAGVGAAACVAVAVAWLWPAYASEKERRRAQDGVVTV